MLEDPADARTVATWKALGDARLTTLGTEVWYGVSDRAKALIQLAAQGLECLSMPDFFHCMPDVVKSSSLAIGRRLHHAHKQLKAAELALARPLERPQAAQTNHQAQAAVEASRAEVRPWEELDRTSRQHLETLSLTRHPFGIADAAPQTSAQVQSQ